MKKIVAAEIDPAGLALFCRTADGGVEKFIQPFTPWILAPAASSPPAEAAVKVLSGSGIYNRRWEFPSVEIYEKALEGLKKVPGLMMIRDMVQQGLSLNGVRLFEELEFAGLRRMQFAVRESGKGEISFIEIAVNGGETELFSGENGLSEKEMLAAFDQAVKALDPDVLEGFNCCREDLVLLEKRAKKLKYSFSCGRDGSGFSKRSSRFALAGRQISYNRFALYGRHIVDILHLAQFHDAVYRDFEEFSLEYLREYFALPRENTLHTLDKLSRQWLAAPFLRCRYLPLNFQNSLLRGNGAALDAMLIAEYCRQDQAVPEPEAARYFAGALTFSGEPGVFHQVRHCDVRSLYPSILLTLQESPARDDLGVFLQKLDRLRTCRLEAKDKAAALPPGEEKEKYRALQSSFKLLINSFYGYLGFAQGCFNDYALAEKVTAYGREILQKLADFLHAAGAHIVEMDTDGIYFCMPENAAADFDEALQGVLPPGIELDFDAEYPAMYCYKAKNYALLKEDGEIYISGAALKSRALEKFQREFIMAALSAKLRGRPEIMEEAFQRLHRAISTREIPLADLAKSEQLADSPESYRRKLDKPGARRSAAYELALASERDFRAGDQVKFYITGTKVKLPVVGNSKLLSDADPAVRDENSAYYLAKLEELYKQFSK